MDKYYFHLMVNGNCSFSKDHRFFKFDVFVSELRLKSGPYPDLRLTKKCKLNFLDKDKLNSFVKSNFFAESEFELINFRYDDTRQYVVFDNDFNVEFKHNLSKLKLNKTSLVLSSLYSSNSNYIYNHLNGGFEFDYDMQKLYPSKNIKLFNKDYIVVHNGEMS